MRTFPDGTILGYAGDLIHAPAVGRWRVRRWRGQKTWMAWRVGHPGMRLFATWDEAMAYVNSQPQEVTA